MFHSYNDVTAHTYRNMTVGSPGPFRFTIAVRPARTGIIHRTYLTRSHYFPVPPRLKPVNSPAESRSTPDWLRAPDVAGYAPRHGRAPVYRNSTGTHRGYTGIRTLQSYGNAPV
ncbi:hypothetical protein DPMN_141064 [Dreissena polymorpha]|uniref:Uncharacterized protein n=1 Tax=Dreissena polymorpha TaxID=45954 RepID=A0A9D4JKY1_DREPO|nr:hypothetical protein DPMN_141064 [Dreissena polymorpha]